MSTRADDGSARLLDDLGRVCKEHEIEPGRSVVNNWDKALFEPWAERKARLAAERSGEGSGRPA